MSYRPVAPSPARYEFYGLLVALVPHIWKD